MDASRFLVFSGHNERAVVALCRFFAARGLPHALVGSGAGDALRHTRHAARLEVCRIDARVDLALFEALAPAPGEPAPIYVPTTEFINHFVLAQRGAIEALGWRVGLPDAAAYHRVTDKWESQQLLDGVAGLRAPRVLPPGQWRAPCVLKPRTNVRDGAVHYPRLCLTPEALALALAQIDARHWFAQEYLDGQSFYLCAYLARDGRRAWFWQQNLLQQPGGKSIVLARTCPPPGIDADAVLDHLAASGCHGPLMMEVIAQPQGGRACFIEINPRFWGPLQLALDACPALLELFAADHGHPCGFTATAPDAPVRYYAWRQGAEQPGLRAWPALAALGEGAAAGLLAEHDLYRRADTIALHRM